MLSVASRTPGDVPGLRTPSSTQATAKAKNVKKEVKRRKDPVAVRRRQSVVPYIVLFGITIWGTWWYGSKQDAGLARSAADKIGTYADAARDMVSGYIERAPDRAPEVVLPTNSTPPEPVKKASTKRRVETSKKPVADTVVAPVSAPETTKVKADSLR